MASEGCVASTFLTSDLDRSGMDTPLTHNWEGFAVHMAAVTADTTGGLPVGDLESLFAQRLDNFSSGTMDAFMDYSVTFFTQDLNPYLEAFARDDVPLFLARWEAEVCVFLFTPDTY